MALEAIQTDSRRVQITKDTIDQLVDWLKSQVQKAGADGYVVGMSGGLDSAVTAVLCKQACPDSTLGVIMPIGSNPADATDAELISRKFHIPIRKVDLTGIFELLLRELTSWGSHNPQRKLAVANLKPRLRMTSLYFLANEYNFLVAGTGDKSELELGYFTKYGDGGVDLLPLGPFTKTEVAEIACLLRIPERIINRVPTAGLWHGQSDEEELGLSYKMVDEYLRTGRTDDPRIAEMVEARRQQNRHKRQLPPVPEIPGF